MKKTLTLIDYEKYAYPEAGLQTVKISNTLSSLTVVGSKVGSIEGMQSQLTAVPNVGSNVEKIGDYCFWNCKNLEEVNLGLSVKLIGDYAFAGCSALNLQNMLKTEDPNYVYSIGNHAFEDANLSSIAIVLKGRDFKDDDYRYDICLAPDEYNGPHFGDYCFANNKQLKNVKFKCSNLIGNHMFDGCSVLTNVEFTLTTGSCVGEAAFAGCTSLSSITFPRGFELISDKMFEGCSSLTAVNMPNDMTKFFSIGSNAFSGCTSLSNLTVPPMSISGIHALDMNAFAGSSLSKVTLNNLTSEDLDPYSAAIPATILIKLHVDGVTTADFKYGRWYGQHDNTLQAFKFGMENNIPMVIVLCNTGCGRCDQFKNVMTKSDVVEWVGKSPYLFIYINWNNTSWNSKSANSTMLQTLDKFSKRTAKIPEYYGIWCKKDGTLVVSHRSYGNTYIKSSNYKPLFIDFYDELFKDYVAEAKFSNSSDQADATLPFTCWGIGHDCLITVSDGTKYTWNQAKMQLYNSKNTSNKTIETDKLYGTGIWYTNNKDALAHQMPGFTGYIMLSDFNSFKELAKNLHLPFVVISISTVDTSIGETDSHQQATNATLTNKIVSLALSIIELMLKYNVLHYFEVIGSTEAAKFVRNYRPTYAGNQKLLLFTPHIGVFLSDDSSTIRGCTLMTFIENKSDGYSGIQGDKCGIRIHDSVRTISNINADDYIANPKAILKTAYNIIFNDYYDKVNEHYLKAYGVSK